jgi:hypothetical protein
MSLFYNLAQTTLSGNFRITLHELDEVYDIKKYATINVYNVFFGTSEVQLEGDTEIVCEKNKTTTKGYLGKDRTFKATILGNKNEKLIDVKGHYDKTIEHKAVSSKEVLSKKLEELKRPSINVSPLSEQGNNESRKVWHSVTVEINKGDFEKADIEKKSIEEIQRKIRNERKDKFVPNFFENDVSFGWKIKSIYLKDDVSKVFEKKE